MALTDRLRDAAKAARTATGTATALVGLVGRLSRGLAGARANTRGSAPAARSTAHPPVRSAEAGQIGQAGQNERAPAVVSASRPNTKARVGKVSKGDGGDPQAAPALQAGRQTLPTTYNPIGLSAYSFIVRREYQDIDISALDVSSYDAEQMLSVLADLSPDVSRALWNVLRMAGTDIAFKVTSLDDQDDDEGQAYVNDWLTRLGTEVGGFEPLVTQLILTAFMQGAVCIDLAPSAGLDDIYDIYPVNPSTIYFERDQNQNLVPFQRQALYAGDTIATYRRMNTLLFQYYPIDPYPDEPYGRSPVAAVLQVVFFQVQVLRDLQRVIHTQGWPKIDIKILQEVMERSMPPNIRADPRRKQQFLADRLNEVRQAYEGMNPEDAYVHPDYVEVSGDAGAAGKNLFDIQGLLQVIRIQVISALKQLPTIMGEHVGSTETYSSIELTIFSRSIDTFRRPIGKALSEAFVTGLRLKGKQCKVIETWDSISIYDPLTVAKTQSQEAANAAYERDQGWITQDQASLRVTGSKAVAPAPVAPQGTLQEPGPPAAANKPAVP